MVDFGTATTFDALSAEGDYLGGAIAPGIGIAAEALFQRTAKLPRIDLVRPPAVIGKNTVQSMQSGLLFGYVGLVEGMVARFRAELGPDMKVIATGGLASLIAAETDVIDAVDPWLTLEGLRLIWEMNQGYSLLVMILERQVHRPGRDRRHRRLQGAALCSQPGQGRRRRRRDPHRGRPRVRRAPDLPGPHPPAGRHRDV